MGNICRSQKDHIQEIIDRDVHNWRECVLDSKMTTKIPSNNPGTKLSDYTDIEYLSKGHFGKVYKVRSKLDDKIYCMKSLNKNAINHDEEFKNLAAEKEILSTIDHPNITKMYSSFQTKNRLYFVMDLVSGGELFYHLKQKKKFDEETTCFYAAQIVLAVEHLHKKNILYRDLKPENILLDENGNAVLIDFGLAKLGMTNNKTTKTVCGTPEYIAPEIIEGRPYDKSADWWSLGVLIYEMLTGKHPFKTKSNDVYSMYKRICEIPVKMRPELSSEAKSLINGLLTIKNFNRLGYSDLGAEEIKFHDFFKSIDWDLLEAGELHFPAVTSFIKNEVSIDKSFEGKFKRMEKNNAHRRDNPVEELLAELSDDEIEAIDGVDLDKIKRIKTVSMKRNRTQKAPTYRYFDNFDFARAGRDNKS
ncbi:unnamed protein product [Moneuplotes crassus]|uniref:Protein kinase domain-containing protein n=1 Tax=Euplotes crassus TaxID=5936 RepID=A0AAD1USX4_EUPCR|nr:unnamed protein product [Moneuplotes crassus]